MKIRNPSTEVTERCPFGRVFVTDDDGRVTVGALGDYTKGLVVIPNDKKFGRWNGHWAGGAEQVVVVSEACQVEARVLTAGGAPVADARVASMDQRTWRRPVATTDKLGRCMLSGLAAGQLVIKATAPKIGGDDITVRLRPGERINYTFVLGAVRKVRVIGDGVSIANRVIRVRSGDNEMLTCTDDVGEAVVPTSWFANTEVYCMSGTGAWLQTELLTAGHDVIVVVVAH